MDSLSRPKTQPSRTNGSDKINRFTLIEIARQIEKSGAPQPHWNSSIFTALGYATERLPRQWFYKPTPRSAWRDLPDVTKSLDAAVALLQSELGCVGFSVRAASNRKWDASAGECFATASTPAAALTAATLCAIYNRETAR